MGDDDDDGYHQQHDGNKRQHLVLQGDAYDMFFNALKTEATKRLYVIGLRRFMGFQKAQYVSDLLGRTSVVADAPLIQSKIIQWIVHLKNVENVPSSTLQSYLAGVMKCYTMNDLILNKDKIHSYLTVNRELNNNTRGYTRNEIAKLLSFCGPREHALVLLLASTGMRVEAAAELKIKHLHKNDRYRLYKIVVYQGYPHEYICFTTPEAAQAIDDYFAFRRRHGEKISSTDETPETRKMNCCRNISK
jgi:hypothetical protein